MIPIMNPIDSNASSTTTNSIIKASKDQDPAKLKPKQKKLTLNVKLLSDFLPRLPRVLHEPLQQLSNLLMSLLPGRLDCGEFNIHILRLCIHIPEISVTCDEQLNQVKFAVVTGPPQRRAPVNIIQVNIHFWVFQKQFDNSNTAVVTGERERSLPANCFQIDVDLNVGEKEVDGFNVVVERRDVERRKLVEGFVGPGREKKVKEMKVKEERRKKKIEKRRRRRRKRK